MGHQALAVTVLAVAAPASAGFAPPADPRLLAVECDGTGPTADPRWAATVPVGSGWVASSVGGVDVAARERFTAAIDPGSSLLIRLADTAAAGKRLNLEQSLSQVPGPGGVAVLMAAGAIRPRRRRQA